MTMTANTAMAMTVTFNPPLSIDMPPETSANIIDAQSHPLFRCVGAVVVTLIAYEHQTAHVQGYHGRRHLDHLQSIEEGLGGDHQIGHPLRGDPSRILGNGGQQGECVALERQDRAQYAGRHEQPAI